MNDTRKLIEINDFFKSIPSVNYMIDGAVNPLFIRNYHTVGQDRNLTPKRNMIIDYYEIVPINNGNDWLSIYLVELIRNHVNCVRFIRKTNLSSVTRSDDKHYLLRQCDFTRIISSSHKIIVSVDSQILYNSADKIRCCIIPSSSLGDIIIECDHPKHDEVMLSVEYYFIDRHNFLLRCTLYDLYLSDEYLCFYYNYKLIKDERKLTPEQFNKKIKSIYQQETKLVNICIRWLIAYQRLGE
jgi:hypothetical protein